MLTDYTTYDEVRAVLGLSTKDLEDATLSLSIYERNLTMELAEADPNVKSQYLAITLIPENTRTAAQQTFFEVTQVFAAYSVSRQLLTSLPYFALQRVTDGRAEGEREHDAFKDTKDSINATYNILATRLKTYFAALGNNLVARESAVHSVGVGISYDPVTA
jgi:hypothetical protein